MKDEKIITSAKKAYNKIAKLQIEGNKLVIRNLCPPHVLHKFVDGREYIPIGKSEIVRVNELIK